MDHKHSQGIYFRWMDTCREKFMKEHTDKLVPFFRRKFPEVSKGEMLRLLYMWRRIRNIKEKK